MSEIASGPQQPANASTTSSASIVTSEVCGVEVFCYQCGYDLRAAAADGNCPECGEACGWSVSWSTDDARRWRRRVMWGARLIVAGMAIQFILGISGLFIPYWMNLGMWFYWSVMFGFPLAVVLVGAILLTTRWSGDLCAAEPRRLGRRTARWLYIVGTSGILVLPFIQHWLWEFSPGNWDSSAEEQGVDLTNKWLEVAAQIPGTIVGVLQSAGEIVMLWFVGRMAGDMLRSSGFAKQARVAVFGLIAASVGQWGYWIIYSVILTLQGWTPDYSVDQSLAGMIPYFLIGLAELVFTVWYVWLLWLVAKRLGRDLKRAKPAVQRA